MAKAPAASGVTTRESEMQLAYLSSAVSSSPILSEDYHDYNVASVTKQANSPIFRAAESVSL